MNTFDATAQYRQGDVLIERMAEIPAQVVRLESSREMILAHGEATGHRHVLKTEAPAERWGLEQDARDHRAIAARSGDVFISLTTGGSLVHPEHAPINLPPGSYRVTRQREYSPAGLRPVGD